MAALYGSSSATSPVTGSSDIDGETLRILKAHKAARSAVSLALARLGLGVGLATGAAEQGVIESDHHGCPPALASRSTSHSMANPR